MALRESGIARNVYDAELKNIARTEHIGEMLENDRWYKNSDEELKNYLKGVLIAEGEEDNGTRINLGVALLDRKGISRVLEQGKILINQEAIDPYEINRKVNYYKKNYNIEEGYRQLQKTGFFTKLLDDSAKNDIAIAYENNAGFQIHQTTKQMMDGLTNILEQDGMAVGWDLESTAGINVGERNIGQHITEFSFVKKNLLSGSKPEAVYSSVIGATDEEYQEYLDIIEKYEKGTSDKQLRRYGGTPISSEEQVTADRLMKMGYVAQMEEQSPGSAIDWTSDKAKQGIITFKKFVSDKEVPVKDSALMRKGAEFLKRVYQRQQEAGVQDFTFNGQTYKMFGWEAELLKGLNAVQHGGKNGEALTAIGHNTMTFDINVLNRFFGSGRMSEGGQAAYQDMFRQGLQFDYNLDTLSLTRRFLPKDFYDENDLRQMEKLGLTENQQESIVRRLTAFTKDGVRDWSKTVYDDPRNAGAAHMAVTDVLRNLEMTETLIFKQDGLLRNALYSAPVSDKEPVQIEGGKGQLFFARSHLNEKQYNLLQLMKDSLSGEFRTADSIAMAESESSQLTEKQLFGQFGMQRGVTYKVERLFSAKTDSTFHDIMKNMYPGLDIDHLTVLELQAYAPDLEGKQIPVRAKSPVYYIGSKQDIANAMMDNTFFIGEVQQDNSIDISKVSDFTKEKLSKIKRDNEGNIVRESFDINEVIADSAKRAEQEAAARNIRQHSYSKDKKLVEFIDFEEETVSKISEAARNKDRKTLEGIFGQNNEETLRKLTDIMVSGSSDVEKQQAVREALYKRLWENSVQISKDLATQNPSINVNSPEFYYSFNNILGFKDRTTQTKGNLFSESLTGQIGRLEWARKNITLLKAVQQKARDMGQGVLDNTKYYYASLMQGIEDYVTVQAGKNSDRLGWQLDGVYSYTYDHKFDIDLSGYHGLAKGTTVSLNLEARPESMTNAIIRAAKGNLFKAEDYTVAERGAILRDVQKYLYKTRQIGHFTDGIRADKKEEFQTKVLEGKTNYSDQFVQEFRSQTDPDIKNPFRIREGDSEAVAAYKLLRTLKNKRETGDFVGHLTPTYRQFADAEKWNEIVPEQEIDAVLNKIEKSTMKVSGVFGLDATTNKKVVSESIVNDVVENVLMDSRLHDQDEFNRIFKDAGYTEEDRKALFRIRELHKQGLQRYVRSIFNMIGNIGGQAAWDADSRQVIAFVDGKALDLAMPVETLIDGQLQYKMGPSMLSLPVGVYDLKGGFNDQHELKFTSIIEKAVAQNEGLISWHTRQALLGNGTMRYRLEKAMSSISQIIREAPAVTEVGLTSRGNQFKVQYSDLISNLQTLLGQKTDSINAWQTDDAYKKILKGLAAGDLTFDKEHPAYEQFLAAQANIERLFKEAYEQNIIDKDSFEDIISNFTADVKGAQKLAGQAAYQGDFYTRWNGHKRNPAGIEDATKLDVTKLAALSKTAEKGVFEKAADIIEEFEGLRNIGIGKAITDQAMYSHATARSTTERQLNTHVQLNVLHASPMSLNALVTDNLGEAVADIYKSTKEVVSEGSMNLLVTAMPDEGVGFMHGHIFDRIFSERDTIQKLGLRKIIDHDNRNILNLKRKTAAMPVADIIDGKIKLSYGSGSFVEQGDIIGHVPGFDLQPHGEGAKYEGILKLGAFNLSSGHLETEEEISATVNSLIEESIGIDEFQQMTKDQQAIKIVDLLEQKYNLAYYLQTERANPLVKIAEMAEKGMVRGLILGTGEADDRIAAVMQELGFYGGNYVAQEVEKDITGNVVKKQITKTLGRVDALDIRLIDDLLKDNLGSFLVAAQGRYELLNKGKDNYKQLDIRSVQDVFQKHGFQSAADFRRAVLHERYEPSRLMAKVLEKADIYKPDKETFHMITNHLANMKKHGDISAYRYLTAQWLDMEKQGNLKGDITNVEGLVKHYLLPDGYKGDITRQGDTVVLSEAPEALQGDITKIRQAYYDTGIVDLTEKGQKLSQQEQEKVLQQYYDTGIMQEGLLKFSTQVSKDFKLGSGVFENLTNDKGQFTGQYEKTRADFARVGHYWDWAKDTYDAVKFNQRALTILGSMRADEHGKENIRKFLEERQSVYGKDKVDIYDTFIKDLKKGEIINSAATDQIYRNMFNRAGGGEKLSGFIATDEKGNLKWGINEGAVRKFVRDFGIAHGDEQKGVNIMTSVLGKIYQEGLDGRKITTVNEAGAFNLWKAFSATAANSINDGVITSAREAERLGFKTIKLEDILAGKMGAGDFDQSLYGHNWLIDLGDHSVFGDRLYKELENNNSGRFVAIAANHIEEPGKFREAIADEPQARLKSLLDSIDRYQQTFNSEGGNEQQKQEEFQKILQKVQDIKSAQYNVWAGKGGIMAEATKAWMHDAYRATAKGQQFLGTESVDKAIGKAVQVDNLKGLMDKVRERREQGKAVDISKLSINGIKLVQEAQKGAHALQFNYSILSLERMNKIYDQGFGEISDSLVNAGIDKTTVNDLISRMSSATKQIAQTEGVEGISAREPLQYYGSVTQRKIFFNSLAQGNEAIGDFVGAQARKEDFDSDAVVNALHKEQAELTVGDKKVNIEVDSAMLAALSSQAMKDKGVSIRLLDEGAEERFNNYKVSQFFTGAGEAQRYRTISDFKSNRYDFEPMNSLNFEDLVKKLEPYDEKITKNLLPAQYANFKERQDMQERVLRDVYRDMVKKAGFNFEDFGTDFLMASGETQRIRLHEYLDKQAQAAGKVLGEDLDLAYEALKFSFHDETLASDLLSHAGRVPTGRMNRFTQNMYDIVNEVLHNEGAEKFFGKDIGVLTGQLNLVNLAMQEGFLSPKNERLTGSAKQTAEALRAELMPKLEKAYNDVFSLGFNATTADRAAAKKQLSDAMLNVVLQRSEKEIVRDPTLPTLLELIQTHAKTYDVNYQDLVKSTLGKTATAEGESVLEQVARAAVNNVTDFLVDNVGWTGNERHIFAFGSSHASGNLKNIPFKFPKQSNQAVHQLANVLGSAMQDLGVERPIITTEGTKTGKPHGNDLDAFAARVTGKRNPPVDISSIPQHDTENIAVLKKAVREAKSKTIMSAAVGIAGGLIISGFANNPAKKQPPPSGAAYAFGNTPIPGQSLPDAATGMAADGAAITQPPISLSDNNLNVMRGAPSRAYMINISGTSPRGEAYAVNAIHSAVAGPVPQNSSINVAMNSNYTDMMSQAQMGRMIQTAMGF